MNNKIISVLCNRQFFYLFAAEVFSQIAFNMMNFILLIIAFKLSNSNTAVSGIVLTFTIPAIFFGILAGAYVDRWNKKSVLFATNIIRALILISLAFLHMNLFLIYILSFATAVITQFFIPAETPVIPLIVKKDQLFSANALFGMGIYGSILVAYAMSGMFLILLGPTNVFVLLSLFFILAAILIYLIKIPKQSSRPEFFKVDVTKEIKNAFGLIAKTRQIYQALFLLTLSQTLILILAVIGPGFAKEVLEIQVDELPLLFITPAAFGMIFGAVIIGNFFNKYRKQKMANLGVFLAGFSIILLPYGSKVVSKDIVYNINAFLPGILNINILHIVVLLAFVLGIANALIFIPSNTILQEKTSDEIRGKIYGVLNTMAGGFSLLPIVMVGKMADVIGVAPVLTGIGLSLVVLSIVLRLMR
ncbi:MAG: MFS transporter [Candidatus Levybacteria bacterium]|nr:MFS transporter [Candidatus Levybacteria bacterium]